MPYDSARSRTFHHTALRGAAVFLIGVVSTLALVPVAPSADAAVVRGFAKLYSEQINGSIQATGNTVLTCNPAGTNGSLCAASRAGTNTTHGNNQFSMVTLDADDDPTTTVSSTADVALPPGSTVAKAYLFWGASTTTTETAGTIGFRTPRSGYQTLSPERLDLSGSNYSAYRDVTDLVRTAGSGTYGGADFPLATGSDKYAGWNLVIAVSDPHAPLRDLSIFSGYAAISSGESASASISGFLTPPTGAVASKVGMVVYEGDIQLTDDQFRINGTNQSDGSAGSTTNFFNSRVSTDGVVRTDRNPAYVNSFGAEAKTFTTSAIPNDATSATLQFTSSGDVYFPAALTSQVDLYAPTVSGTKTVTNLTRSGTAQVGDLLEYALSYTNTGDDNSADSVVRDVLPAHVTYVPGSLRVTAGAGTGAKTDTSGDDTGEYLAPTRTVRVRVGAGATAAAGGTLAKNAAATVVFRAVLDDPSAGTTVDNVGLLDYRAPQIGRDYTYSTSVTSTPVSPRADLAITKSATPTAVVAGSPLTYTLTVTNKGANEATGVVVSDALPDGVVLTSATPSSGTCRDASGTVTCELGTVPTDATRTITISTQVRPAFAGSVLTNVATVSSALSDPVAANNTASVTTTVSRAADVAVTKTVSPTTPVAGRDVTYTIAVRNSGPSTATAVTLADTVPAVFLTSPAVTASTTAGSCTVGGRVVGCELGNLAPGGVETVTVVARLDPAHTGGAVANTAGATTTTPDPTAGNNSSTATFTPAAAQADLVVDKATVTSPVVPGRPVEYRITVVNNGPSDAVGVVLDDAAPGGIAGISAAPSQGTCTTAVSCALGTLPAGSTATVTVTGVVAAAATGTLTNVATATSTTRDPAPGTNTDSTSDVLQPRADVTVSKAAGPAIAGSNAAYTVTVTNNGPSTARDVVVSDPVPAPLTLVSASGSQGSCSKTGATARCDLGTLAPGASATMTVVAGTPADGSAHGAVNTATVTTSTTDPTPGNNTASHTLTAGAQADLELTKTAAPSTLVAGGPVTFTLTARNNGPSNASGISITDTLPAHVLVGALPAGCSRSGQTVTCTRSALAAGATHVVQVSGTVAASTSPGTLTNTATVSSASPVDPNPSDNTATSSTPVVTRADLSIDKTGPARGVAGGVVEYAVSVTNHGPSDARGVVVTDQLPPGTVLVSSPDCALQPGSTATATCSFGTLAADATRTTTLRVRVEASQAGGSTVTNTAQVASTTADPTPGNNSDTAATVVDTRTDLTVTKTATPSTLVAGQEAVYTVTVTNTGPSDARDVKLVDTLPGGVTLVSAATPSGTCTGTSVVTCERGVLAASGTWTATIRVLVGAGTTATQVNTVAVSSATPEATPGDNRFELPSPVTVAGDLAIVKTVQPTPVAPGRQVVFGLTAVNNGPATATGTVVTDVLPDGLSGAAVTLLPATAGTCDVADGTVTCTLGSLAPGQPATATVTAILAPGYAGASLANTATIASDVADPRPGDNSSTVTAPVRAEADLTVTKRADTSTVVAGQPLEYIVEVGNAGPSMARDVTVTDLVPADLTVLSATLGAGGPACAVTGRQVSCSIADLAPGAPATVVVRVRPHHDLAGTQVSNTASATAATADPVAADNTSTLVLPVTSQADVSVTKTRTLPAAGPVVPGNRVTWTVTVANPTGPSTARGITVVDAVDTALTGVTATGAGSDCSIAADNRVSCTIGRLGIGDSVPVTISGTVPADFTGELANTATTSATTSDPDADNNTSTVTDTVEARAGVSITKHRTAPASGPIVPGRSVSWRVTVSNAGPSVARAVTLTDDVVDGLTGVVATATDAPGATCEVGAGNLVTCDLGDLAVGAVTVTITADVPAGHTGALDNTAAVTTPTDTTPGDNTATSTGTTRPSADVAVTKTRTLPAGGPVVPGEEVSWEVTVDNLGPSVAAGVTVTDDVLDALVGVTATAAGGTTGTCTVAASGARPNLVTCALGSIAPSAAPVVVTISGRVPAGYTGTAANSVTVATTTPDPVAANDTAGVGGAAQPVADVSVTKTRSVPVSGPVVPGADVEWAVTVTNAGPSSATGVTLSDDVLDALTSVTATGPASTPCTVGAGNTVACDLPDLAPHRSVTVVVRGGVPAGHTGSVDNTAVVASPTDTTPGNNQATSTGPAQPQADVSITKSRTSGPVVPGRPIGWDVVVANAGPSVARRVTVTDDVLDVLTGTRAHVVGSPAGTTCSVAAGNVVDCELGGLPVGASTTIHVTADVPADHTGSVDNSATVASPTDTTPDNNEATSTGAAVPTAGVSVTKQRTSGQVVPGDDVAWRVTVASSGPSVARDVTLTDDVLDAFTDVAVRLTGDAPADADCGVADGNVVSCDLGDLPPGATVTAVVTGSVPAGYAGTADNTVTVDSPTDTTPDDNAATSTGTARPRAEVSVTKTRASGDVVPGRAVTWDVVVTSSGPSLARDVVVTDDVLDALTDVTARLTGAPTGATCDVADGNAVSCDLGDLPPVAPGHAVTITIAGDLPAGYTGTADNTATVAAPADTTAVNNEATSTGTAKPRADVAITKTRTTGTPVPGRPVSWDVVVTSAGPSLARGVTVTDDLLDALTGVTVAAPAGVTCDVAGGNAVGCDLGDLAPGNAVTVTVSGDLPAGYTGPVDNTAVVAAPIDSTPGNNRATSTGTAKPQADVAISKTRTTGTPVPGRSVTWDVVVTNAGPSLARDVTVTDDLLDALTGVTVAAPAGVTCDVADGNAVGCDLGALPAGATGTATITLTGHLPAGHTGAVDNTARVLSPTDTTADNNEATSTGTAAPVAGVSVRKLRTTGPVVPGQDVTWQVVVRNDGPSTARDVTVTDDVLEALTGVRATIDGDLPGSCTVGADNAVACDLGDLPPSGPGSAVTITVTGGVPAQLSGAVDNTAVVASPTDDTPDDNSSTSRASTADGTLRPRADVSITKARTSGPVVPGRQVTWRVEVTNAGPSTARDVVVHDDLLDVLTDLAVQAPSDVACTTAAGNVVACTLGDLAPRATVTVTVTASVPAGLTGAVDNTATVDSPTDASPGNNEATSTGTAEPQADVSIAKTRTSGPVVPGQRVTWDVVVTSSGPSLARDVVVSDDLLDDLTGLDVRLVDGPAGATCDVAPGHAVTCDLGDLRPTAPHDRVTLTISADVPAGHTGAVDNTARVDSPTDTTADNNEATSTGTAQPQADVSVTKTRTTGAVVPGRTVTWDVVVSSSGPSVARDVTVTDDVLDALTDLEVELTGAPAGATCDVATGNVVTCDLGDLPPGAPTGSATVTISGHAPADLTGPLDNTARIASPTDTTPGNNEATSVGVAAPQSDVSVAKTRTTGVVVPGRRLGWNVVVNASGPSVARDVTVTDDVLDALTDLEVELVDAPAGATCDVAAGNVVTCELGDLPTTVGSGVVVAISGDLPAGYTGTADNTARVASPTDATPSNNASTSTGTAQPRADVAVTKTRTSGPVVPGRPVAWQVTVANAGPSTARDVSLTDDLLDALAGVDVDAPAGTDCTVTAGQALACDLGDLPPTGPGSTVTVTVSADVPAGHTGALDNTATIDSPTDATPDNNRSTSTGTAEPQADVSIVKTRTSGTIVPGRSVTWQVTVTNAGPSVARDVVVTDDLVDALTDVAVTGLPDGACPVAGGNVVTCDLGDLAPSGPGSTVVLTITGAVPPETTGALDNTATVDSPTDTTPDNNGSTSTGTAEPQADVSIVKTRTSGTIVPGRSIAWQLTVANAGPSTAHDVVVTDELLEALTDIDLPDLDAAACTGSVVSCDLGDLPPAGAGSKVVLTVNAAVPSAYTGALDNTAVVGSPNDASRGNDESTSLGRAEGEVDLSITKTLDGTAVPGDLVSWTLEVANDGPSVARDVVVTDQLPAGVGEATVTGPDGSTCEATPDGLVTCGLGDLPVGETRTLTVGGRLAPGFRGDLVNEGRVGSSHTDTETDPDDNVATATDPVVPSADLAVTKAVTIEAPLAGGPVGFTITVTNNGPSTSTGAVVTDPLDAVIRDARAVATGATTCRVADGSVVTCSVEDLAPGATAVVTVTGTLAPDASGPVANTVTVAAGAETDPQLADNEATATTEPVRGADLAVVKDARAAEVLAGGRLRYRITVTNAGPATAADVVVTDELPEGLTADSATAKPGGTCSRTQRRTVVTCSLGDLAVDDVVRVTLTTDVAADAPATLVNEATVRATTLDPETADNTDSAEVRVVPAGGGPGRIVAPAASGSTNLPDTGSDARTLPLAVTGCASMLLGVWLLRRSRRRTD